MRDSHESSKITQTRSHEECEKLFYELYEENQKRLFLLIYPLLSGDKPLTEDLTQDFWVKKVWQRLIDGIPLPENFESWSTTVLMNKLRDHLKNHNNAKTTKHGDDFETIRDAHQYTVHESDKRYETLAIMEKAVQECAIKLKIYREILLLLPTLAPEIDYESTEAATEIASQLNRKESYIKTKRPKAIRALQQCLKSKGIKLTDLA